MRRDVNYLFILSGNYVSVSGCTVYCYITVTLATQYYNYSKRPKVKRVTVFL